MSDQALPPIGARVDAVLDDGRAVAGEVLSVAVGAIFFRTEDRIEDGTELRLQWPGEDTAREAAVCVYPSARKNVMFAKVLESEVLERRAVPRIKPSVTLLVRVEPILRPDGMSDPGLNGTIVDISTMAVAFVSERRLPDNTAVTVGFRSRQGRAIGGDVPGKIVRFEHRDPRFLVVVRFEGGDRQKGTIDEVLAACRVPGEGDEGEAPPA
jgi:hypothetical protein